MLNSKLFNSRLKEKSIKQAEEYQTSILTQAVCLLYYLTLPYMTESCFVLSIPLAADYGEDSMW